VFWIFVLCLLSDQSECTAVFMVFNCWIGPGFIFQSTALGLDLFSGEYHNKLQLLWCPLTENIST
jgi:hypothetical protein